MQTHLSPRRRVVRAIVLALAILATPLALAACRTPHGRPPLPGDLFGMPEPPAPPFAK